MPADPCARLKRVPDCQVPPWVADGVTAGEDGVSTCCDRFAADCCDDVLCFPWGSVSGVMGFAHLTGWEGRCERIDDEQVSLTLRVAVVGKSIEHPRGRYRAVVCLRGRIELVAVHSTRIGIVCVLPAGSLSGDDCGLAVGGFGRRDHDGEPGRVLSGESPLVVQFSKGLRFCRVGCTGSSVSCVLAVDAFLSKAARSLIKSVHRPAVMEDKPVPPSRACNLVRRG